MYRFSASAFSATSRCATAVGGGPGPRPASRRGALRGASPPAAALAAFGLAREGGEQLLRARVVGVLRSDALQLRDGLGDLAVAEELGRVLERRASGGRGRAAGRSLLPRSRKYAPTAIARTSAPPSARTNRLSGALRAAGAVFAAGVAVLDLARCRRLAARARPSSGATTPAISSARMSPGGRLAREIEPGRRTGELLLDPVDVGAGRGVGFVEREHLEKGLARRREVACLELLAAPGEGFRRPACCPPPSPGGPSRCGRRPRSC